MQAIQILLVCFILWLMMVFIGLNWLTGCESWDQPNCISPLQIVGLG